MRPVWDCCGNRETCTRDPHDCSAIPERSRHTWVVTHYTFYRSADGESVLAVDDIEHAHFMEVRYTCGNESPDRTYVLGCGKHRSLLRRFDREYDEDLRNDVQTRERYLRA